jgi:aryl-alcohol dehydrogenase-like predicted oxidoreductase
LSNSITHRIALGTVQFGLNYGISNADGKTSLEEVTSILSLAKQQGISTLDTAAAYGNSEEVVGKCADLGFQIVSKFIDRGDQKFVRESLHASLQKLKRNSLYGYLAHHASTLIDHPTYWEELILLKENKQVEKIGYSLYTTEELEKLLRLDMIPDIVQLPFNLLDQRFLPYFKQLKDRSVEIHVRSAFLQGLLLMEVQDLGAFFNPVKTVIERLVQKFSSVDERAAALVLFCLQQTSIDKVVIGVNTKSQLENNLAFMQRGISIDNDFHVGQIPEHVLMPNMWPKRDAN